MAACEPSEWKPPSADDSHEDPAKLRPGYGNDELHTWWPLTSAEMAAVRGIDKARAGDAHALFALAVLGSGDRRDDASYARFSARFDQFIADHRAAIEAAADDDKRGDLLNRAMHKTFFTGSANKSDPKVGAYELDQARLTQIFEQGHYNCISSALLYTTLARAYSLPVRGAMTEIHAFVDFGPDDGARLDVETTTERGFGEVHDEKFFRDAAKDWSSSRGLRPLTIDDYKKREIVPPYVFVARAMNDKRIMVDDETQNRLSEVAAMLAPDDADLVHNRLAAYANEAKWLFDHKAFRTILRMIDVVSPFVSSVPDHFPKNEKILADVAWMAWHDAKALSVVGRGDEAVAIADDFYGRVQPTWPEAAKLELNFLWILADRMTELQTQGEYEKSLAAIQKRIAACHDDSVCLNNLYLTFDGWCVKAQLAKDWAAAKKVMQTCISLLPDDTRCHHTLDGLNDQHPG
ncbi:MAG TPA: hypothetical protein VGH28_19490 [Polyangiaceae bacterium]|jgi:hypothetical protein